MKTISKMRNIIFILLVIMATIFISNGNVFAAEKTVDNFADLKTAIETASKGDVINVNADITLADTLDISGKDITIKGSSTISATSSLKTVADRQNTLFVIKDSKVTFDGITLDGASKNRVIYSENSNITLTSAKIKNGHPGSGSNINPGGGIFLRGGSLTATDTNFTGNTPGTNDTLKQGDGDLNGGAIYSGGTSADITITGGKFENNEVKAYGHGAAIYQEAGSLTVDGTSFKNNKGHVEGGNAGTQGACIHTRDKVTATISGVTAEIAKGFNTGGFLRSWKSDVTVTNSTFTIAGLGDGYGYSGGALCFEGGTSEVKGSTFTCTGSKLIHAGGFIDIVGTGTHTIDGNEMTGAGKENGQQIASFGGAISVEEGASATVTITNNTIKDTSASDTGGAIAIGTHKGKSTPSTVTMSGNTISNAGTLFWGAQYGGGVFVGPDATVTMTKDTIKDTRSSYGGGIYNEGNLTITGGSSLTGGVGSKLGGEIYNNGDLIVDDATITGNFVGGAIWEQYASHGKNYELGGTNIYAEKDVTITPKANIATGKDVRVLDGQSKILLTGPLTKEIDVSVSEVAGGSEEASRKVGYVVAAGKDGYAAIYDDANFLHYIGRTNKEDASHYSNQPRAEFGDHESTGEWDFVLNPNTKQVVLGQRVKLTLYANGIPETPAKFEGVKTGRNKDEGILTKLDSVDTKEDIYDIYIEGEKLAELSPEPVRKGYEFTGWYEEPRVSDDSPDKNKSGKTLVKDLKLVKDSNEITSIIDPPEYELFAGWEKVVKVEKVWDDNNNEYGNRPDKVTVKLLSGGALLATPIELNAQNNWKGEIRNIKVPKRFRGYQVKEFPGQVTGYKTGEVIGNDIDGFTVTNETEYITIEGSKTWNHGTNPVDKQPTSVTVKLSDGTNEESKTVGANDNWTWKFENLPKYKNKTLVNYTLTENPVDHYTSSQDGYNFTNTFTNKYKVTYKFESGTEGKDLPEAIEGYKPTDDTEYADGATVNAQQPKQTSYEDTENNGTWTFTSWDANSKTIDKADVKFVGTWTFTKKEEPKTGSVYVKYVDEEGKEIAEKTELKKDTPVGEEYTATPKVIAGYQNGVWQEGSAPETGTVKEGEQTVVYVYKKIEEKPKTGSVYVKYVDEAGKEIAEKTELKKDAPVDEEYSATAKTIAGYEKGTWQEGSAPETGTVKEGEQTVVYVYKKADEPTPEPQPEPKPDPDPNPQPPTTDIITKYVDEDGNNIIPPRDGDRPKEFIPGYEYLRTERSETLVKHIYTRIHERDDNPWFPVFPSIERDKKIETHPVKATVPEKVKLNKEDHKAYMFGYPDWTFLPNKNMTRAEVTAMFARLLKNYPSTDVKYNLPYSDVFEKDWYYPAVGFMTENKIVTGYEDGKFRPNDPITRAEFATIASKFEDLVGDKVNGFYDVPESHWALKYINSAYARGWVAGYEDGSFRPDRNITRAEVVTITNKMLIRYADVDFVRANKDLLINFKDLDEGHWAYFNIMEATHGHDFMRKSNGKDELWERLNGEAFIFPELRYKER